jgi:hypothetical protein
MRLMRLFYKAGARRSFRTSKGKDNEGFGSLITKDEFNVSTHIGERFEGVFYE